MFTDWHHDISSSSAHQDFNKQFYCSFHSLKETLFDMIMNCQSCTLTLIITLQQVEMYKTVEYISCHLLNYQRQKVHNSAISRITQLLIVIYFHLQWHPILLDLKQRIESNTGFTFNSVLCTLYEHCKDGVQWHSNDQFFTR